mmetsp:Transcript_35454/g.52074  ORF Transcript_35454/g.52074 Transcript_35454/m.52074 type:complete len:848 (+) Transcript_35454:92-2635(+)|eukprot:CAMPEP_0179428890 /NCGR_PEP_ID=MMETSP0799-20121207/14432_1 /TAXON_ID=46947 /ORGANISM="Geminigera cryophila, Strain CCMP2564" /LENGTH=847 /DNA_ID=CAMNT_0021204577 /DNA_START=1420 /DNA_END=3963 /DNA_ORIENTATION=+
MSFLDYLSPEWWRDELQDRGWEIRKAKLAEHYYALFLEQVAAVVPISILLISVMGIFFGVTVDSPVLVVFGLTMAILGLTVFIDALRVVVMPLSEQLGTELPKTLELPGVLCVTCFLGVLVTYAEPAITSLRPLARLVDPDVAPYLYCILMEKQELLVFCIGLGVGLAAMLGTLRFVRGWSLKPMISCSMVPCLMCACYMWWGDPELRPLLGLAWDCGAVTTGPVTVPVLLALGIGVMKTQKEKRLAAEVAVAKMRGRERVAEAAANALEGFGIVTLASLMPVLAVELLAIGLKLHYTHEDIIAMKPLPVNEDSLLEHSPYREIYFAVRAILPLNLALVALVVLVLKKPLPEFTYYLEDDSPGNSTARSGSGSMESPERSMENSSSQDRNGSLNQMSAEFVDGGRGGVRVPKSRSSLSTLAKRRSMDFYRSIQQFSKKKSAKGSMSLYGDAVAGMTAYSAAQAQNIPTSFRHGSAARPSVEMSSQGPMDMHETRSKSTASAKSAREKELDEKHQIELIEKAFSGELHTPGRNEAHDDDAPSNHQHSEIQPMEVAVTVAAPSQSSSKGAAKKGVSVQFQENTANESLNDIAEKGDVEMPELRRAGTIVVAAALPPPRTETSAESKKILVYGVIQAQVGMIMFNLGLNFGFTSLGDQVGTLLPAAFIETPSQEGSPFYSFRPGVAIALGTMFTLGVLATRAEPALNVLGQTVEKLTKGSFTKNMLISAVCFGVGTGMTIGATKILFGAGIIYFIMFKYAVALTLTAFINEDFVNIAWDSAGVTTGPVTVPFVLSVGVGCSKAVQASEGFGILACASVWPIISVLSMEGLRRLKAHWKQRQQPDGRVQMF